MSDCWLSEWQLRVADSTGRRNTFSEEMPKSSRGVAALTSIVLKNSVLKSATISFAIYAEFLTLDTRGWKIARENPPGSASETENATVIRASPKRKIRANFPVIIKQSFSTVSPRKLPLG
jgi:hypothetical protein